MKKIFVILLGIFFLNFSLMNSVYAVDLSVEAPTDTLSEGQVFDFKINIDTQGESVSSQQFDVTYDTRYVEFDDGGFLAGDFFDQVNYSKVSDGVIYVDAENTTPKSGSGLIAVVKLKIIATAPGSTTLCAVAPVSPTPTLAPSGTPVPTPSVLPRTGSAGSVLAYSIAGLSLVVLSALIRKMLL